MREVDGHVAANGRIIEREQLDPSEVFDLADGHAHHIRQTDGPTAAARRLGAGGLKAYREQASEAVLGRRWRDLLEGLAATR